MPDLPSGTVTFLFTDIEGSTALWSGIVWRWRLREVMAPAESPLGSCLAGARIHCPVHRVVEHPHVIVTSSCCTPKTRALRRESTPSLANRLTMWVRTVSVLTWNWWAIS